MTLKEIEDKLEELMPGKGTDIVEAEYNKNKFKTTWCDLTEEGVEKFNSIYKLVMLWPWHKCTKSGGICKKGRDFRFYSHYVYQTRSSKELIIIAPKYSYRVILRSDYGKGQEGKLSGRVAFSKFCAPLKKKGYDIFDYSIDNGMEVKKTIPKYDRRVNPQFIYKTIEHAFHFDGNSAFFSGIAKEYGHLCDGELGKTILDIYNNRKNPAPQYSYNKDILTHTQGFFQSEYCKHNGNKYCLAHMAKAGIVYTCEMIKRVVAEYEKLGCEFIASNTDGAWMTIPEGLTKEQAEKIEGYGKELGQFKIDYWDCKLRYKGPNAYEFIDQGKVIVKFSGLSKLDKIKPRDQWEWGDIFRKEANPINYVFILGKGVVNEKETIDTYN